MNSTSEIQRHTNLFGEPADEFANRLCGPASTVLTVWAHPDDEAFVAGGLMAALAGRGTRVVNLAATLGEHGTSDPEGHPPTQLGRQRREELRQSLTWLGAEPSQILGYEDGTCADVPVEEGTKRVGRVIDAVRPDLIVSFGPDGVTGHPDHQAVASWTARAVKARHDEIPMLTTQAAAAWPDDVIEGLHRVDAFYGNGPDRRLGRRCTRVNVAGSSLERKLTALAAHRSQMGPLHAQLGPTGLRRMAACEAYRPANELAAAILTDRFGHGTKHQPKTSTKTTGENND